MNVRRGTFTLTVAWSVCVDFQAGVVLALLFTCLRGAFPAPDGRAYKTACAASLALLFAASFAIRAHLQHPVKHSIVRLGEHTHFSDALTAGSYEWIERNYRYAVPVHEKNRTAVGDDSVNAQAHYAHDYLNRLYLPTHARFGPMALGALLAFAMPAPPAAASAAAAVAWWKHGARWWAHVTAFGVLCVALVPPPPPGEADAVPPEAHAFMTTALRNMFAAAAAVLLYSALVPQVRCGAVPCWARQSPGGAGRVCVCVCV